MTPRAGGEPEESVARSDRVPALAWIVAAVFVAVELAVSGRYGFMQDELYFVEAGRHLAFGYVDQPPLMPLLTRVMTLAGTNPVVIRIIPALAGGAVVLVAARLSALFGAGRLGRVLAALAMACTPVLISADHVDNTTPLDLLAWGVVLLFVCTALLRDRPRCWLGAGVAAGLGLQNNNMVLTLLIAIVLGVLFSSHRVVLRTRWPWLGAAIAAVIWAPNVIWQAANGWPEAAMSSALRQQNDSLADYLGGVPTQLVYLGLIGAVFGVAGFVSLWRRRELRFAAVTISVVYLYVLAVIPGKVYYAGGVAAALLAVGAVAAERWIARRRRPRLLRNTVVAVMLVSAAVLLADELPIVPIQDVSTLPASAQESSSIGNTVGWPQLVDAVVAADAGRVRAGDPPTSVFTGYYAEAAALNVLGQGDKLPPVLSGHNAYWMWGPGSASDQTVLVVDGLSRLRPYFASCRPLSVYRAPFRVSNEWTPIQIGLCTGPSAGWQTLWPRLKHYD